MDAAVPYTVLGGYLGAGKTTLLNRLLHHNRGRRIALLINDFGAINIDAELIESKTDQQINLTNGCVCCGLSDGFDEAITSLLESAHPPEHIVVEASGVADVHSLAQYGNTPGLALEAVVVVADALNVRQKANDKYVAQTVRRQLAAADLVLLNKVDLVDAAQLQLLCDWLTPLCNNAPIIRTEFCALPEALLLGDLGDHRDTKQTRSKLNAETKEDHQHSEHYATWHYKTNQRLNRTSIEHFLRQIPPFVLRAKGFFTTTHPTELTAEVLEWHQVGTQQRLTVTHLRKPDAQSEATTLVAIGLAHEFDRSLLDSLAAQNLGS